MLFENLSLSIIKTKEYTDVNDYIIRITNINTNKYNDFTHCESKANIKNDEYVLMSCLECVYHSYYTYYEECTDVYDFIYIHIYDDEEEGLEAYEITKQEAVAFNEVADTETLNRCKEVFDL